EADDAPERADAEEIAGELAGECPPPAGEGADEVEVGIPLAAGVGVMGEVLLAIAADVLPGRIGAEPLADEIIEPAAAAEGAVGRLVHQHREREVTAAEDDEGDADAQRARPLD